MQFDSNTSFPKKFTLHRKGIFIFFGGKKRIGRMLVRATHLSFFTFKAADKTKNYSTY